MCSGGEGLNDFKKSRLFRGQQYWNGYMLPDSRICLRIMIGNNMVDRIILPKAWKMEKIQYENKQYLKIPENKFSLLAIEFQDLPNEKETEKICQLYKIGSIIINPKHYNFFEIDDRQLPKSTSD